MTARLRIQRRLADLERQARARGVRDDKTELEKLMSWMSIDERLEAERLLTAALEPGATETDRDLADIEVLRLENLARERRARGEPPRS